MTAIADWLMSETAPVDIPDLQLKAVILRLALESGIRPSHSYIGCANGLCRTGTRTRSAREREQAEREEFLGLVERAERLGAAVGGPETTDPNEGTNRLIRLVLF